MVKIDFSFFFNMLCCHFFLSKTIFGPRVANPECGNFWVLTHTCILCFHLFLLKLIFSHETVPQNMANFNFKQYFTILCFHFIKINFQPWVVNPEYGRNLIWNTISPYHVLILIKINFGPRVANPECGKNLIWNIIQSYYVVTEINLTKNELISLWEGIPGQLVHGNSAFTVMHHVG